MNDKPIPFFKRFVIQNFPFIEEDFDSLTNYQLFCKVVEYLNKVIGSQNEVTQQMEYVLNYFNNLDVQDEVDHKLDEMAESGELTDIIAGYLNLRGILAYDTVANMKAADNLVDGSFVETYGFYTKGDGGGAKYKVREVTNEDVIDNIHLFPLSNSNNLVAELNEGKVINVIQLGVTGNGETDDTEGINYALKNFETVIFPNGLFICNSENVECKASKVFGTNLSEIRATVVSSADYMWRFPATQSQDIEIKNMKFNSNNIRRGCVYIGGHNQCSIENCEFTGYSLSSGHYGTDSLLILNGGNTAYVNNCYFHDSGYQYESGVTENLNRCITAQGLQEIHVENCRFYRVMQGIVTQNVINYINNCYFDFLKDNCIYNLKSDDNEEIVGELIATNNYLSNRNSEGIVTSGLSNIISNNIFEYIPNSAISIKSSLNDLIVNNNIFRNLYSSIETTTASGTVIKDRSPSEHTVNNFIFNSNKVDTSAISSYPSSGLILYLGSVDVCQFNDNIIKFKSGGPRVIEFASLTKGNITGNIISDTNNSSTVQVFNFTTNPNNVILKNNLCDDLRIGVLRNGNYNTEWVHANVTGYIKSTGGGRIVYASTMPSAGTWKRGDIVFSSTPSAGGTLGWVCVAAGSPGTWKAITGIAS